MDIPFEGRLTQDDYRQAFALHFRPTRSRRLAAVLLAASLLAVALLPLIIRSCGLVCWRGYPWPVWALLVLCGALVAWPWWYPRYLASLQYKASGAARRELRGTAGEQGMQVITAYTEAKMAWPAYRGCRRTEGLVLLYTLPNLFSIMPRTLFQSDAEWQAFGDLVERNLTPEEMAKGRRRAEVALAMLLVAFAVLVAVLILSLVIWAR